MDARCVVLSVYPSERGLEACGYYHEVLNQWREHDEAGWYELNPF